MTLIETLRHPVTALSAAGTVVLSTLSAVPIVDPTWLTVIWAQAGNLFTVVSIAASTIAPEVPYLDAGTISLLAVGLGTLFATRVLWGVVKSAAGAAS